MPKVINAASLIEEFAPLKLKSDFDNIGLMCGFLGSEINGILLCLDVNRDIINEALQNDCNLIISHHPLIFSHVNAIDYDTRLGEALSLCCKNDINVLSYHTNIDKADSGLSYEMGLKLGGSNFRKCESEFGVLFDIPSEPLKQFSKSVASAFNDRSLKVVGDSLKNIKTVFAVSGSGGRDQEAYFCAKKYADVFLTSEVKHNFFVEAKDENLAIVEISHYHSEVIVCDIFERILAPLKVKILKAKSECPFRTLEEL